MKIKQYKDGDEKQAYQGDISIIKIEKLDVDIKFSPLKDKVVVGHSESGHHHVVVADRETKSDVEVGQDKQGYFIRVNTGLANVVHEKVGGHETQKIGP